MPLSESHGSLASSIPVRSLGGAVSNYQFAVVDVLPLSNAHLSSVSYVRMSAGNDLVGCWAVLFR